jgi:predicted RNase H-like HicB family nuclease
MTKENLHLPILVEMDEDGYYIVSCPVFRGCHAQGKTIEEAISNIREVVEMCLEDEKEPKSHNRFVGFRELEITANSY